MESQEGIFYVGTYGEGTQHTPTLFSVVRLEPCVTCPEPSRVVEKGPREVQVSGDAVSCDGS